VRFPEPDPDPDPSADFRRALPGHRPGSRNRPIRSRSGTIPRRLRGGARPACTLQRRGVRPPAPEASTVPESAVLIADLLSEAQGHFRASRYTAAEAFLRLIPRPTTPPGDTWRELGNLHYSLGQYAEAGKAFGYAAAYRPDDADLQVNLALTCLKLDDIDSFEGYLTRALRLEPDNRRGLKLLADLHREVGSYTEAARVYRQLTLVEPGCPEHVLSYALCRALDGSSEDAVDALRPLSLVTKAASRLIRPQ
jgi:tetratricopeptide (TPR) repeat protein